LEPVFFQTRAELRTWFAENHLAATELLLGLYKRDSGRPSVTMQEAVEEALCVGWIDSVERGIDAVSYSLRFTPRKPRSKWSAVNIRRVENLIAQGLMLPAGLAAYERRAEQGSPAYSHEHTHARVLGEDQELEFRANAPAWDFFQGQPPSYRKAAIWWVTSAKREDTRLRRLAQLIECSAQGVRVPPLVPRVRHD
jgi:uncharacterized protein YdeI (YjbR/CyaY-like superfamily)